jgi:hypothetical protein
MSTPDPSNNPEAADSFEAELRATFSPAQPLGPDRIDDDDALTPPAETQPPNLKHEGAGRMKH